MFWAEIRRSRSANGLPEEFLFARIIHLAIDIQGSTRQLSLDADNRLVVFRLALWQGNQLLAILHIGFSALELVRHL